MVPTRLSLAGAALVAYLGVVVVVGLLPAGAHRTLVAALAFSPSDLASGRLWLLPLSGFVVEGALWAQVAVLAPAALALVVLAGARTFWRAAVVAHVGSTIIAYAILELVDVAAPGATGDLFRDPDYGVSCVWAGAVGALAVVGARSWSGAHAKAAVAATVGAPIAVLLAAGFGGTLDIASVEHLFAFLLGALVALRTPRAADHGSGGLRDAVSPPGASGPLTGLSSPRRTVDEEVHPSPTTSGTGLGVPP